MRFANATLQEHRSALGQAHAQLHNLEDMVEHNHDQKFLQYAAEHISDLHTEIELRQRIIARRRWIIANMAAIWNWFSKAHR